MESPEKDVDTEQRRQGDDDGGGRQRQEVHEAGSVDKDGVEQDLSEEIRQRMSWREITSIPLKQWRSYTGWCDVLRCRQPVSLQAGRRRIIHDGCSCSNASVVIC